MSPIDLNFIQSVNLEDAYQFMIYCKNVRQNNETTRARRVICIRRFYAYLTDNLGLLEKNPMKNLDIPKTKKSLPKYLSLEEAEKLLSVIDGKYKERDYAMITLFLNCGMRLSELVSIDYNDIKADGTLVITGKGNKERVVYFDARTKIHLQNYLNSRKDDNPALFVSLQSPYNRMNIGGIEVRLRQLGKRLGLNKVHPHKFRRTLATMAIDKGMPIEQLQQLLGHRRIDTTLQYAMVKQSNVKIAHRKYIG